LKVSRFAPFLLKNSGRRDTSAYGGKKKIVTGSSTERRKSYRFSIPKKGPCLQTSRMEKSLMVRGREIKLLSTTYERGITAGKAIQIKGLRK